jgi:hypothetical protein
MPHDRLLDACIVDCLECYSLCRQHSARASIDLAREQLALLDDCSEVCRTTAALLLTRSRFQGRLCGLCAEACEACADACDGIDGMEACTRACRGCALSCAAIASLT